MSCGVLHGGIDDRNAEASNIGDRGNGIWRLTSGYRRDDTNVGNIIESL
jgi:hypothetical protein